MKKEVKRNNSKIIFEIILVPLCFLYLFYTIFESHPKASFIFCLIITMITSLEFAIKYLKEVYIYENKYNPLKIIFGIFNIILIIVAGLNFVYNINFILILFYIMTSILLIFILWFVSRKLIFISKNKGVLYKNAFSALFSLTAFMTILITFIIKLFSL